MEATYTTYTAEQLYSARIAMENIQKRNPPSSQAWQDASVAVHLIHAENNRRFAK